MLYNYYPVIAILTALTITSCCDLDKLESAADREFEQLPSQPQSDLYYLKHTDLSVALNMAKINPAINRLTKTTYEANYETNGVVCSSPHLTLKLNQVNTSTTAKLLDDKVGSTKVTQNLKLNAKLNVAQCAPETLYFEGECNLDYSITSLTHPSIASGECHLPWEASLGAPRINLGGDIADIFNKITKAVIPKIKVKGHIPIPMPQKQTLILLFPEVK
ncbi:hypothetical protein D1115_19300 [Vibrio alfacsensis]|uniref:Lipoprotein n=1 Tax=Vibrio alfacsensis TaxID=1074311 RepID=A0ABN5PIR8_9VIBR|nr:hypothetical protein [Vibrio alfacsensis]AXY03072.1 hypothetical protein D1115_19300 [Vibrio alfacsensis]